MNRTSEGSAQSRDRTGKKGGWTPYVVLVLGIIVTGICTNYVSQTGQTRQQIQFSSLVEQAIENIDARIDTYVGALRGTAGLYAAVPGGEVSRQQLADYLRSIEIRRQYPGIAGIGFATRISPGESAAFEARVRQENADFRLRPQGSASEERAIVNQLEPADDPLNRRAAGFDLLSDPVVRNALETARDTGAATASGMASSPIELDTRAPARAGFLICVPVYRGGAAPPTRDERRQQLLGFIFSPFRAGDLLKGIYEPEQEGDIAMAVYDDETADSSRLLHAAPVDAQQTADSKPAFEETRRLDVAGRTWTIHFKSNPSFEAGINRDPVPITLICGLLLSASLFFITRMNILARGHAESAADEMRVVEQSLRASEARFRRLAEANMIGVVFATTDGEVRYANAEHCKSIGRKLEEVVAGRIRWTDVTAPEYAEADARAIVELQQHGVCVPYEKEYIWPDGTRVPVLIGVALLEGSRKETVGFTVNLAERKRQENELLAAKEAAESANRAKDQFLAVLSHELRTPLTPVLAIAAAGQDDERVPQSIRADFEVIRQNVELEARLIDDLLDLTKIGRGKLQLQFEMLDAHQILDAAVKVCSAEQIAAKRLRVQVLPEAEHHHVRGDPARLQQIFWNLIKNAVKFTPEGGRVTVRTFNEPPANGESPAMIIEVSDSGIGIDPDFLPKIFDAFEQAEVARRRQFGGLGLGLAISKGLVDAHGGTITARSDGPDRGATFSVTLHTVSMADQSNIVTLPGHRLAASAGLCVLLVEDHQDTNRALSRLLRSVGYQVHSATSVAEAVRVGNGNVFDVLLSDLGLPDGTGIDLLRQLRGINGRKPWKAIALTGFGMDEDIDRTTEAGFCDHLTKPVNFQKLQAAIERVARQGAG